MNRVHVKYKGDTFFSNTLILQRYVFIAFVKNSDTETLITVFVGW